MMSTPPASEEPKPVPAPPTIVYPLVPFSLVVSIVPDAVALEPNNTNTEPVPAEPIAMSLTPSPLLSPAPITTSLLSVEAPVVLFCFTTIVNPSESVLSLLSAVEAGKDGLPAVVLRPRTTTTEV